MDQTPIAFEFLLGKTYEFKGSKTVQVKEARSGWDRRQATLQICVFVDGVDRCRPLLIFHRAEGKGDSRRIAKSRKYAHGVDVLFNPTAWATEKTMLWWIQHSYRLASPYGTRDIEPKLLALDAFRAHMIALVISAFQKQKTTISMILGGYTSFVQVLDVALNQPLKRLIKEEADEHYDANIKAWEENKYSVGDRRVLLIEWVSKAWGKLHIQYKETIVRTFRQLGMSLNPNGCEDLELKIKALDGIQIGDWERHDISQEEENNQGAQQAAIEVTEAVIRGDIHEKIRQEEDEVELSITWASLRLAAQPLKNLYFLENEAGEFDSDAIDARDSDDGVLEHQDTNEDEVDHIMLQL